MKEQITHSKERMSIEVGRATPADVSEIQDVFYEGWRSTYPNVEHGITTNDIDVFFAHRHTPEAEAKRTAYIENTPEGEALFVARDSGHVVGVCRVIRHADRNELKALYVLPAYQKSGVGKKLWEQARSFFDATKDTVVDVAEYNENARQFYERLGFEDVGDRFTNPAFAFESGATIPEMRMRRRADTDAL